MQPHDLTISGVKIPNTDKFLCEINGILVELRGRSFRLLALLALARVTKKDGWLNMADCYGVKSKTKRYGRKEVSRLRGEVIAQSPKQRRFSWMKWRVADNDRRGNYRLAMDWDRIQVPDDLPERFQDADIAKAFQDYKTKRRLEDAKKRTTGGHPWRDRIVLKD